ncbi:MAG: chemotaxis protein CheW [Thermoanaerobaculales bacterium]|nr:chemotaxis protein CheW [Thermoanaerobaculales bacterium]
MNQALDISTTAESSASIATRQFVTFSLATESYGIDVCRIYEFIAFKGFTRIPNAPEFISGVINLRGTIVPVIDLRLRLGVEARPVDGSTVIIIVDVHEKTIGLVVDAVDEVITLPSSMIQPSEALSRSFRSDFIAGISQIDEKMIIIVDIERVLSASDLDDTEVAP